MKIALMAMRSQYLEILNLTPEEEDIINDEDDGLTQVEKVESVLKKRGIPFDDFDPWWMVVDDYLPVFDEKHQEEPLLVL